MIPGGWQLNLYLLNATVTPESDQMAAELSSSGCGAAPWKVREAQDLRFGCSAIGLKVPANTKELARIEESPFGLDLLLGFSPSPVDQQMVSKARQLQVTSYDAPLQKVPPKAAPRNEQSTGVSSKKSPTSTQAPIARPAFTIEKTQHTIPPQPLHSKPAEAAQTDTFSEPRVASALLQWQPSKGTTNSVTSVFLFFVLAIFELVNPRL